MTQNRHTEFEAFFPHENVMHVLEREQTVLRSLYQGLTTDFSAGHPPGADSDLTAGNILVAGASEGSPADSDLMTGDILAAGASEGYPADSDLMTGARSGGKLLPFNPLMPFCPMIWPNDAAFDAGRPVIGSLATVDGWIVRPVFFEPYEGSPASEGSADAGAAGAGSPADSVLMSGDICSNFPDLSPFPPLPCPSRIRCLSLQNAPAAGAFCIGYAGPEAEELIERYLTLENPVRSGEKLVFPLALKVWYFASMKLRYGKNETGGWFCFWECGQARWKSARRGKK